MKTITNFNLTHTDLSRKLAQIIMDARSGHLQEADIQIQSLDFDDEPYEFGIRVSTLTNFTAGYTSFPPMVDDYLRLMILCGFRDQTDLWDMVKADYTDDEGTTIVEGCYTNHEEEEYTRILTVSEDNHIENEFGQPIEVDNLNSYPERIQTLVATTIIKNDARRTKIANELEKQIVEDYKNGDTTVLFSLLRQLDTNVILQALPEERWKDFDLGKITQEDIEMI